jgi:hypothetical protein
LWLYELELGEAELETPEAIAQYFYDVTDRKMPMPSWEIFKAGLTRSVRAASTSPEWLDFY